MISDEKKEAVTEKHHLHGSGHVESLKITL